MVDFFLTLTFPVDFVDLFFRFVFHGFWPYHMKVFYNPRWPNKPTRVSQVFLSKGS